MWRELLAATLICAFIVLAATYEAHIAQHLDYPRESEVNTNYDAYVGRNVTISGVVVSTDAQSFALKGTQSTYVILSSDAVQPGDRVTLVGTLEPGHQLQAAAILASPRLLSELVYVRSLAATVFLAALFFLNWRFDRRGWVFRPRKPDDTRATQEAEGP